MENIIYMTREAWVHLLDKIRAKAGTTDLMTPETAAAVVEAIQTGGGGTGGGDTVGGEGGTFTLSATGNSVTIPVSKMYKHLVFSIAPSVSAYNALVSAYFEYTDILDKYQNSRIVYYQGWNPKEENSTPQYTKNADGSITIELTGSAKFAANTYLWCAFD